MLYPGADTREIRWTCPGCGLIETEIMSMPKQAVTPPKRIEVIELHCDACDRVRMGLTRGTAANRVFDSRTVAPDY